MVSSQMGDKEQRCLHKSEMCLKFLECEMVVGGDISYKCMQALM